MLKVARTAMTDAILACSLQQCEIVDDEVHKIDGDTQTMNYEHCENMHNIALLEYKRTICFVHTLQLVVQV